MWRTADEKMIQDFVNQFLLNHPNIIQFFRGINKWKTDNEGNLIVPKSVKQSFKNNIYSKADSSGKALEFIRSANKVYQKVPNAKNGIEIVANIRYKEVSFNLTSAKNALNDSSVQQYTPVYSPNGVKYEDMADRGVIYQIGSKSKEKTGHLQKRVD